MTPAITKYRLRLCPDGEIPDDWWAGALMLPALWVVMTLAAAVLP